MTEREVLREAVASLRSVLKTVDCTPDRFGAAIHIQWAIDLIEGHAGTFPNTNPAKPR
jgi:hypothetical protein